MRRVVSLNVCEFSSGLSRKEAESHKNALSRPRKEQVHMAEQQRKCAGWPLCWGVVLVSVVVLGLVVAPSPRQSEQHEAGRRILVLRPVAWNEAVRAASGPMKAFFAFTVALSAGTCVLWSRLTGERMESGARVRRLAGSLLFLGSSVIPIVSGSRLVTEHVYAKMTEGVEMQFIGSWWQVGVPRLVLSFLAAVGLLCAAYVLRFGWPWSVSRVGASSGGESSH